MTPDRTEVAKACLLGALLAYEPLHAIICWGHLGALLRMGPFFAGVAALGWLTSSPRERAALAGAIGAARVGLGTLAYLADVPGYVARAVFIDFLPIWGQLLLIPVAVLVHGVAYWLIMTASSAARSRVRGHTPPAGAQA